MPLVDEKIEKVNELIRMSRRNRFDNFSFWDFRYAMFPDTGSGIGSRGSNLVKKRELIRAQIEELKPDSVIDVGCGDLEVMKDLSIRNYTGIDISHTAVDIAKSKRPDWEFVCGQATDLDLAPADLVICMDVLIHQPTRELYEKFCGQLLNLSKQHLIVAAYNQPPWYTSELTFYYEPISATFARLGAGTPEILGGYRDITLIRWTRD
jgi:2-polyprenyl-3-methyl-5-hydroxy-6-metoxy-1,4-benzoquinol methylase